MRLRGWFSNSTQPAPRCGGEIAVKSLGLGFQAKTRCVKACVRVHVCVLWLYIYFAGSLGADLLVRGTLNMYGIFLP